MGMASEPLKKMTIVLPREARSRLETISMRHLDGLPPATLVRRLVAHFARLDDAQIALLVPALRRGGRAA